MPANTFTSPLIRAGLTASLLLAGRAALAQQQINLTAGPATAALPDGTAVPMWGYRCGAIVAGATATCAPLSPAAAPGIWSPVVITVPYLASGTSLTINLTNALSFTPTGATTPNAIPTSLTIVGQLGGGLGSAATAAPSPTHAPLGVSWPTPGTGASFVPPP